MKFAVLKLEVDWFNINIHYLHLPRLRPSSTFAVPCRVNLNIEGRQRHKSHRWRRRTTTPLCVSTCANVPWVIYFGRGALRLLIQLHYKAHVHQNSPALRYTTTKHHIICWFDGCSAQLNSPSHFTYEQKEVAMARSISCAAKRWHGNNSCIISYMHKKQHPKLAIKFICSMMWAQTPFHIYIYMKYVSVRVFRDANRISKQATQPGWSSSTLP